MRVVILAHLLCNDGSIEADCTNLELGTKVECGDIFVNDVDLPYPFFPFLVEKVEVSKI